LREVKQTEVLSTQSAQNARSALGVGVLQAFRAVLIGFIPVALVTLVAWSAGGSGNGKSADAIHGAGWIWLAAHHVGFNLRLPPGEVAGRLWLLPLGLSLIPWFVLRDSGRRITSSVNEAKRGIALFAFAITYAFSLTLAAFWLTTKAVAPEIWAALPIGFAFALVCGAIGVYGIKSLIHQLRKRSLFSGVGATSLVLYGASSLVLLGALITHWSRFTSLFTVLEPGWIGMILLVVLTVAALPNAVIMTASLVAGAGFAVGNHTLISPLRVQIGELPAFPLLASLPTGRSVFLTLLPVITILASAVGGFIAARSEIRLLPKLQKSFFLALANLTVLLVLSLLAGGPLLGGHLSAVGSSYLRILMFAAPLLIVGSAFGGLVSLFSRSADATIAS
jgi:hypothetical protein